VTIVMDTAVSLGAPDSTIVHTPAALLPLVFFRRLDTAPRTCHGVATPFVPPVFQNSARIALHWLLAQRRSKTHNMTSLTTPLSHPQPHLESRVAQLRLVTLIDSQRSRRRPPSARSSLCCFWLRGTSVLGTLPKQQRYCVQSLPVQTVMMAWR
jgi:hypothetical protein